MNTGEITEEWLQASGFRWHQLARQPSKHWLLWVGDCLQDLMVSFEDLGIEISAAFDGSWHVWIRGDISGRYSRFIHVRQVRLQRDVIRLFEGLTGVDWTPLNHINGNAYSPEGAAKIRQGWDRLDHLIREAAPHASVECDSTRGRALPEHLEAHAKSLTPSSER